MQSYIGDFQKLTITAPGAMPVDVPYVLGNKLVIPTETAASGDAVTVITAGMIRQPKVSAAIANSVHTAAEALTIGQRLYYDATNAVMTGKAVGLFAGFVAATVADTATEVRVLFCAGEFDGPIVVRGLLDATLGKAIGTHELTMFGPDIPIGYQPVLWHYKISTTFTSATDAGTIALGIKTDDEDALKAALAISNGANPYDAGTFPGGAPVAGIISTAARKLCAVVAVEALTAGVMSLTVLCVKSNGL